MCAVNFQAISFKIQLFLKTYRIDFIKRISKIASREEQFVFFQHIKDEVVPENVASKTKSLVPVTYQSIVRSAEKRSVNLHVYIER